jgi:hypothetical protein
VFGHEVVVGASSDVSLTSRIATHIRVCRVRWAVRPAQVNVEPSLIEFSGWLRAVRAVQNKIEQNEVANGLTLQLRVRRRQCASSRDSLSASCEELQTELC